jgi:hypothetical protein
MALIPLPETPEELWGKKKAPEVPLPPKASKEAIFGGSAPLPSKIMVAKKVVNKGFLFGQVGYGGGEIDLGNGYGLQIVASGNDWRVLQLFKYAIDAEVQTKGWTKPVVKYEKRPEPAKKEERKIVAKIESEKAW